MAGQGANMDQFDAYFQRADLNKDGKISGAEAVAFFQGSNLPKNVLAQIWQLADQSRTGFLGMAEFYNALKLVTVAQSKRELTQDIVKAALYGPAAAKIPAPQINLAPASASASAPAPAPQLNSMSVVPPTQASAAASTLSQNNGFRGKVPNASMNPQYFPSQQNQSTRPLQSMPAGTSSRPSLGFAGLEFTSKGNMVGGGTPGSNILNDWLGGRTIRAAAGAGSPNRGISPSPPSVAQTPQNVSQISSQPAAKDSASGNGFASDPFFGGDMFSAKPSPVVKPDFSAASSNTISGSASSPNLRVSSVPQHPVKSGSPGSLQSAFMMKPPGNQVQHAQSLMNQNQQVLTQSSSSLASSVISVHGGNSTSSESQASWPRMTPSNIQKYTKVFLEVDADRDGKVTGEQARNLFLSWRLPREVLKQVWDLSDQDNDSMLSLKEFCIALYLMERYREGCPLPTVFPTGILFDEALLSNASQIRASQGNATWGASPGLRPQQGFTGARSVVPATGLRPSLQVSMSQADGSLQFYQQNSRVPPIVNPLMTQSSRSEQNLKKQEATVTDKKVKGKNNEILDSREKIEFYRAKMQDLVLYKSRCDNQLNEITERASADKREAELLGKKYEEKYKQVGEIASKLAIEEAKFRDIQERKMELHQAIVKMEQGGSADGILQVRADRIQSDLEELMKGLVERGKKHELDVKPATLIELPFGCQRGIQEGAADWDEDWDKFEDEGFTFVKDLAPNGQVAVSLPKQKSSVWKEETSPIGSSTPKSLFDADGTSENGLSTADHVHANESAYPQREDDSASSPLGRSEAKASKRNPSHDFSDIHSVKSTEVDAEVHRSFDEPSWGAFDNNDDTDSVWGFNPVNTEDLDPVKHREHNFFGSGDSTFNRTRADSPSADSLFQKKSPFIFADSLPGTPLSRAGNSPRYSEASGDHFFDNSSRFDSFSMHDSGFSPARETFTRFDSINSSRDFGHGRGFSFSDDTDAFGSSGPFKSSSERQTPKKGSQNWNAF